MKYLNESKIIIIVIITKRMLKSLNIAYNVKYLCERKV